MPIRCSVCRHPRREEAERLGDAGVPQTEIAVMLDVSHDTVARHERLHRRSSEAVLPSTAVVRQRVEATSQLGVADVALHLLGFALELMDGAAARQRPRLALQAHRAALMCLDMIVRTRGTLSPGQAAADGERRAAEMRDRVLRALEGHPEIHEVVARRLAEDTTADAAS